MHWAFCESGSGQGRYGCNSSQRFFYCVYHNGFRRVFQQFPISWKKYCELPRQYGVSALVPDKFGHSVLTAKIHFHGTESFRFWSGMPISRQKGLYPPPFVPPVFMYMVSLPHPSISDENHHWKWWHNRVDWHAAIRKTPPSDDGRSLHWGSALNPVISGVTRQHLSWHNRIVAVM